MSDILERKLRTFYHRLDRDKDGFLTSKDFEMIARGFIREGKLEGKGAERVKTHMEKAWEMHKEAAGGKKKISIDECLKVQDKIDVRRIQAKIMDDHFDLFNIIDTNQDGYIQWTEFETYFKAVGIDHSHARESFEAMDVNKDGLLSRGEFVLAAVEFCTSPDSTPADTFMGPLVD